MQGSLADLPLGGELEPIGPVTYEAPVEPELGVAFALVKGDRPELVVQKLTELGDRRDRAVRRAALGRAVGR